ncbi:MAG: hypothetical protein ACE5IL_10390 [Myxococcota bacterium]
MTRETPGARHDPETTRQSLRVRVTEYGVPPIHDVLVLGRGAPIGCAAIRKAVDLLVAHDFDHFEIDDPVVSDVITRSALLRRIPRQKLVDFILRRIKPLMDQTEIMHLDVEVEVSLEEESL